MIDEALLAALDPDGEINAATAAKLAKVGRERMSKLATHGRIPSRKVDGYARIFRVADVVAWATSPARKPGRPFTGTSHYPPRKKKNDGGAQATSEKRKPGRPVTRTAHYPPRKKKNAEAL